MITCAVRTHPGSRHTENEDRAAASPARGMFVVADGMGGLADGAASAQAVVDELPGRVEEGLAAGADAVGAVTAAAEGVSERVRRTARCGPGTTGAAMALLVVRHSSALTVHLGDSRIYLARDGRLRRLTDDHVRDGQLTRFVGMEGVVAPGVSTHRLRAGDRLLLCTDGLTSGADDVAVAAVLDGASDLERACHDLVAAAVAGGATDDISVIVVQYGTRAR